MTDEIIEQKLDRATRLERRITQRTLLLILTAEDRKLYAKRGFSSMHEWMVARFKYSDSAAHRRIQAARLLRSVPEVEQKIVTGDLNLSTLSMAQSAIRREEKATGRRLTDEDKARVVKTLEGKPVAAAEMALVELLPSAGLCAEREHKKIVNSETIRLAANYPVQVMNDIEQIKKLLSHTLPGGTFAEVVGYLAQFYLKKNSAAVKRCAENSCEYLDPKTGRVCGSTYQLESDHILPRARGGSDDTENLRTLCRTHNQLMAEEILGREIAHRWRIERDAEVRVAEFLKMAAPVEPMWITL